MASLATSWGPNSIGYWILAEYISFHMRHYLLVWNENGEGLDYVSQNGRIPPPPPPPSTDQITGVLKV